MSYTVLARKYRPQTFEEVYAQEHITRILVNAIDMKRVAQAYLFAGPRGVGKTSMARILAKSLNCENGTSHQPCNVCSNCIQITNGTSQDVVEIDGASNTSVDDVRDLQKDLIYATATSVYKIYIIDEVHMLSKSAFNALLKTLEEPPENVIFIFATTEPHKVLPTIISRCQRFDFKSIPVESIVQRLKDIAVLEQINTDEESLYIIAQKADGGMRDALSLFDQVISYCNDDITYLKVQDIFGILPYDLFVDMLKNIHDKSFKELLTNFHSVIEAGKDLQEFLNGFMEFIRKLLLLKIGVTISDVPTSMLRIFKDTAGMFGENTLLYFISMLMKLKDDIKSGTNAVLLSEMALLKMSKAEDMIPISDLMERLQQTPVQAIHTVAIPSYPSSQEKETIAPSVQRIIGESDTVRENQTKPELTVENLKSKWNDIVEAIKRKSSVSGAYLADALIIGVEKVSLMLEVNNPLVEARIKQCEKDLLNLINSLFDSGLQQLKIVTKLEQKNSESGFSMDKLKEKAPELAKFVEMTDSIIKHI